MKNVNTWYAVVTRKLPLPQPYHTSNDTVCRLKTSCTLYLTAVMALTFVKTAQDCLVIPENNCASRFAGLFFA